ncbi:MAG: two-component regulator propeller domain-containing protein [Saprospiraceae bacterium]
MEDGLSQLTNEYVYKDSEGFVWITSLNGLNRFNGSTIKKYFPIPEDSLSLFGELVQSSFFEDSVGQMWFATHEAINCYDRKNDNFHHYTVSKAVDGYHAFYLDHNHELWFITDRDTMLRTINIYSHTIRDVKKIEIPAQRAIAIADSDRFVSRIYIYMNGRPGLEELEIINSIVIQEKTLYGESDQHSINPQKILSTGDSIIWIVDANELIKYNYFEKNVLHIPMEGVQTVQNFNDTTLLVSIFNHGVIEFNTRTLTIGNHYFSSSDNSMSLLTNNINSISRDEDNDFWFGSWGFGVSYAYPGKRKFNIYNPFTPDDPNFPRFNPSQFLEDHEGHLLCNAGKNIGLIQLTQNGNIVRKISGKDRNTNSKLMNINHLIEDRSNHFWVNSSNGLMNFNSSFENVNHIGDISNSYSDEMELADGRLIFSATSFGLYQLNIESNTYDQIRPDSLKSSYSLLFQDQEKRIWLSDDYDGLTILDPVSWKILLNIPHIGYIGSIIESKDDRAIWVASANGLYDFSLDSLSVSKVFSRDKDLIFVGLTGMQKDTLGKLWITSNYGLIVYNPKYTTTVAYNYEDGLPSSNFNTDAAYQWSDGEMWFGSSRGITKFKPDEIKPIDILAIPQITDILVNDQEPAKKLICELTGNTNISEIRKLTFSYRDNTLTFIANSLEYSAPKNNKVRYWMEGMDADSIETSSGSRIRYTNLPSRKLVFCMQAANSDGQYNPFVRRLEIDITPPFYKTWWFITLVSLALLSLIIYIVYLNFSKRLELQKVRLRLYENLHDDVGSRLTAIVFSADELLRQDKTENPKVQHISKTARSIVDNMRRLVWAIDPENDSMNSMVQKIRYDKNLILNDQIEFHLDLNEHLSQVIVPGEIRYQVSSIVNEALNNISKYARAKNVWVSFNRKDNKLTMIIRDDGVGFNPEEVGKDIVKSSGYGLGNMKKRVGRVRGNIKLNSKPGEGTTITVEIPFK